MVNATFLVFSMIVIIANAESHQFPMGYRVQRTWGTGRKRVYTTFNFKVTFNLSLRLKNFTKILSENQQNKNFTPKNTLRLTRSPTT